MSEEIESIVTDENIESEEITPVETETETAPSARDLIFAQREADLLEEAGEAKPVIEEDNEPVPVIQSKYKVKINGVEEDRDIDDLVANYQKSESADRRLQQAALAQQQLNEERQQLQLERQQFEQQRAQPEARQTDATLAELRQQRKDAMEIGDVEEFDRLDEEISQHRTNLASVPVDYERVTSQASAQALNQIQYETAFDEFKSKNVDMVNDDVLYNLTMSTLNEVCKDSSSYQEAFAKTGEIMKSWIAKVSPAKPTDSSMADRHTRKESILAEPGRLNVKSAPPKEQKEETDSEIIAGMRASRGQPL